MPTIPLINNDAVPTGIITLPNGEEHVEIDPVVTTHAIELPQIKLAMTASKPQNEYIWPRGDAGTQPVPTGEKHWIWDTSRSIVPTWTKMSKALQDRFHRAMTEAETNITREQSDPLMPNLWRALWIVLGMDAAILVFKAIQSFTA